MSVLPENWYKSKWELLGVKPRPYDPYKNEGGCIICGRYELVFPLSGTIHLCERCFRNSLVARDSFGENVRWKRHIALNVFVTNRCDACGKEIKSGQFYYTITNGRLCTSCCWRRLGKQHRPLKIWGDRIVG